MSMANFGGRKMPKVPDLIAKREFSVNGKRNGDPAIVFRLWRPYQPKADYPRCRYELMPAQSQRARKFRE